jgi:hypothetical protein
MAEFQVTLPSRGLLYDGKLPDGKITLKPMTTREQGILHSGGTDPLKKYDIILNNCLCGCSFPTSEWLMTDRLYVMVNLRMRSFGAEYQVPMRCSECSTQYRTIINLAEELKLKTYVNKEDVVEGEYEQVLPLGEDISEPLIYELPIAKDTIQYRFLRGRHEIEIARQSKRMKMTSIDHADPSLALRLSLLIDKVNDQELPPVSKHEYVQSMDVGDLESLTVEVEDNESGLDMTVYPRCTNCGYEEEVILPMTAEFFRPRRRRSR